MKIIRLRCVKGFVLYEILIVMLLISLVLPLNYKDFLFYDSDIGSSIILSQLEAIARRKTIFVNDDVCPQGNCWFNPRGNINQSRTIIIERKGIQHELVIWLGFGRFKVSERFSDD